MSQIFDSVYPDLLQTGLQKLNRIDDRRELLALFSALEHFRRDLHGQSDIEGVLHVSNKYISGLNLFRLAGFWLVNPADFSFQPGSVFPEAGQETLQKLVDEQIRNRRFAAALRQNAPVFIQAGSAEAPERGMLHALAVSRQAVGMFCGVLKQELAPSHEINFSLLSLLLGGSADAIATLRETAELKSEINTLSGLLPVCAWCKKVRDDRGYWEQLETYISHRTDASFTHGICPECQKQFE